MADFYAPQNPGLAAFIQPYLSWRERQANESRLADFLLPKAIPDYLAGLAYGTNPREPPLTSLRSTMAYGLPAVEALGIAPALRPAARGGLAAYGALERRMIPPAGQLNMGVGPGAKTADLAASIDSNLLEKAKGLYGTTNVPSETGYILPNGGRLDFSGRHSATGYVKTNYGYRPAVGQPDYLGNSRNIDHRDVAHLFAEGGLSGWDALQQFQTRTGAVRYLPDQGVSIIQGMIPSKSQIATIVSDFRRSRTPLLFDIDATDGSNLVSKEFKNPTIKSVTDWLNKNSGIVGLSLIPTLMLQDYFRQGQ